MLRGGHDIDGVDGDEGVAAARVQESNIQLAVRDGHVVRAGDPLAGGGGHRVDQLTLEIDLHIVVGESGVPKRDAGRVKPVIKVQSILPAIEEDPHAFYNVFAPITDMVSANPLIDFLQSKKDMPKIENFSCPQIYQRLVIGADGLCMMCANDEEGKLIVGDANKQSIHEIWHGPEMTRVREIHSRCAGAKELSACAEYGQKIAISRRIEGRWHLIGYGEIKEKK